MENRHMSLTDDFRANLRAALSQPGAPSGRAVSLAAGGSESMVRQILSGASKSPRLETIEAIARALNMSTAELLFGPGRPAIERRLVDVFRKLPLETQMDWLERAEAARHQGDQAS